MGGRNWTRLMAIGLTTGLAVAVGCGHSDIDKAIHSNNQSDLDGMIKADPSVLNEPDKQGFTPLIYAAREGRPAAVRTLLDHGAAVDATDKKGSTALMYAADHGYIAIAQMLLDKGANVNAANATGRTALGFAEDSHHVDMVTLLQSHGAK
jgi:ankyrin repeat protein